MIPKWSRNHLSLTMTAFQILDAERNILLKQGKCSDECEEPVDVPFARGCKKTAKCCQKSKKNSRQIAEK